jgi:hypothetical protein
MTNSHRDYTDGWGRSRTARAVVGGKGGTGLFLYRAQSLFDVAGMFSVLVILGVLGT